MFADLQTKYPAAFVDDVIAFCRMFNGEGVASAIHGEMHQAEMRAKWPKPWMDCLSEEIGEFEGES